MSSENNVFKNLDNIFIALFGAQLILLTLSYIAYSESNSGQVEYNRFVFTISAMGVNSLIIILSRFTFFFSKESKASIEKLQTAFRTKSIIRMYIISVGNLFNIAAFFVSGDFIYFGIAALILVLFFTYRPSEKLFERITKVGN